MTANGPLARRGLAILADLEAWLRKNADPVAAMRQLVNELEAELDETRVLLDRAQTVVPVGWPEAETLATLRRQVCELQAGVDEARRRRDLLTARDQSARAAGRIPEVLPGRDGSATERLLRMAEAHVVERETQAFAAKNLGTEAVARAFAPDDRDAEFARELAELRRRFSPGKGDSAPPAR